MRILILTVGTRGDVEPYLALGKGLSRAGHEVTLCACARFESFVRGHGLDYAYLPDDLLRFMETADGRTAMENTGNLYEAVRTGIKLFPRLRQMLLDQVQHMWRAAESVRPDLILFHKKAIGAQDFAEKLGIDCALAFYLPLQVPTAEFPVIGFPALPIGGWYNRLTFRLIDWITRFSTGKFVKPWRKENGLSARPSPESVAAAGASLPTLHCFSSAVIAQPADWPDTATVTGYWFLDEVESQWTPDGALERFLSSGAPAIYVGFGSIFGREPRRTTAVVVDAIRQAGVRAVLATGWGGLDPSELTVADDIHVVESVPHSWLFPRVAAVVHHGGCGTTAAGLRAGKPSVICPFFGDQPFWGARVQALGVGPRPIPQKKLTAPRLSAAIREVLEDNEMQSRALRLGERIQAEQGVSNAVAFVQRQFCDASAEL